MIDQASEHPSPVGRATRYLAALTVGLCSTGLVGRVLHLQAQAQYALIIGGLLLAIPVVRAARRANAAAGNVSAASQRFNERVVRLFFVILATTFTAHWLEQTYHPTGPQLWLLALIRALPIVYLVWQNGRYLVEETDEYLKSRRVFVLLVGTGLLLVVATLWGSLSEAGAVPNISIVWVFPLWMSGVGTGVLINLWRAP